MENSQIELTILMPCLNEAETLATCIRKAKKWLLESGVPGEVLVSDNGSSDGPGKLRLRREPDSLKPGRKDMEAHSYPA